jgi:hypothetical protein
MMRTSSSSSSSGIGAGLSTTTRGGEGVDSLFRTTERSPDHDRARPWAAPIIWRIPCCLGGVEIRDSRDVPG